MGLHETLYSKPFILPSTNLPNATVIAQVDDDTTFGTLDSTMPSSEITSEISLDSEQIKVSPVFPLNLQVLPATPIPHDLYAILMVHHRKVQS
jgi:hypothetical protein